MTKLKDLTDAKIESGRKNNPRFMQKVDEIILEQKEFESGKKALQVGEKSPLFNLVSANGKKVSLGSLLEKGSVVVTFYRGSWCPYCNLQLRALHSKISEIKELGAELVAISPQVPDDSLTEDEISKMDFTVLSDQDCRVALDFGVAWKVPDFLIEHMREDRKLDLAKINNNSGDVLPIPATFIINTSGEIVWSYVNVDYRVRSEPDEIIDFLKCM